jgi:NAD(P)-dependent dehydrogenase (short-subunit alcohol dehydrogenase family)/acyl carrier protein
VRATAPGVGLSGERPLPMKTPDPVIVARPEIKREVPPAPEPVVVTPITPKETVNGGAPATVAAPPPAVSAPPASSDPIADRVLAIVAEKTGYPKDMLDLDLDLEADLGIDTVKQAETFAAIREAYNITRQDNVRLRDYPTLKHAIQFVRTMRPDLAETKDEARKTEVAAAQTEAQPMTAAPQPATEGVAAQVLAIVADKTGYPKDMLDLELDLEADLGVDTVKQAETFAAIREAFSIPRQDNLKLRDYPTLKHVIGFVHTMRPDLVMKDEGRKTEVVTVPAEPVTAAPSPTSGGIAEQILDVVSMKTGYPKDMLDLDLDMEADLGIDTVKQAETFAAIREAFNIPRQDDLKLRDYPTLRHVIGFVHAMRPDLAKTKEAGRKTEAVAAPSQPAMATAHTASLEDADRFPRRVPTPALRPALDLCKPTGVTLDEHSRVIVMMDRGGVGKALVGRLQKRGVMTLVIDDAPATEALEAQVKGWLAEGPVQGMYWLPALDVEPALEEMELADWRELNRQRVKTLYTAMRALYDSISTGGTFLVSATRLGGLHGYGPEGATAPLGGAVTGFTKAYKRERGDVLVKAVDFEVSRKTAEPAEALIAETLADPGAVEIGYWNGDRFAITLMEQPATTGTGLTLNQDTVFVVTGAAGGITSAIVADLAAASSGIFYLLDLVPAPHRGEREPLRGSPPQATLVPAPHRGEREPLRGSPPQATLVPAPHRDSANVALFRKDREALKQKLIEAAKAAGERPTPVMIDKQIMGIEREEAALRAIETVEAAGGTAHYHRLDLRDGAAVAKVVDDIRTRYGRIDVLLHAGGLEISRALADKDPAQFNLVFDVKADGFFNLLRAAKGLPLGATVAFSSVAGRFGNSGQTDYSAANDLLCKLTSSFRQWRPATHGIAIDWTAWGGIGMATRGSIPKIMEMAGIEMLPPEIGIPTIRRELLRNRGGELVVGGRLGILTQEWDATGGLDVEKARARTTDLLMVGEVKAARLYGGLEVETTLDPKAQPFLNDHALEGVPLLPGVMGTEAFAQLASVLAPGYSVVAIEHEQFQRPFKFHRLQPQTLYLSAVLTPAGEGDLIAHTTLNSVTVLPTPPGSPPQTQTRTNFTAQVRLSRTPREAARIEFRAPGHKAWPIGAEAIYRIYFHGPAYQVMEGAQVDGDTAIGLMSAQLPPNSDPAAAATLMAPRLIELCFQTAGVWEISQKRVMALPMAIESVTALRQPEAANGQRLYAVVQAVDGGAHFNAHVVDEAGHVYVQLYGYRTVQLPGEVML